VYKKTLIFKLFLCVTRPTGVSWAGFVSPFVFLSGYFFLPQRCTKVFTKVHKGLLNRPDWRSYYFCNLESANSASSFNSVFETRFL